MSTAASRRPTAFPDQRRLVHANPSIRDLRADGNALPMIYTSLLVACLGALYNTCCSGLRLPPDPDYRDAGTTAGTQLWQ